MGVFANIGVGVGVGVGVGCVGCCRCSKHIYRLSHTLLSVRGQIRGGNVAAHVVVVVVGITAVVRVGRYDESRFQPWSRAMRGHSMMTATSSTSSSSSSSSCTVEAVDRGEH